MFSSFYRFGLFFFLGFSLAPTLRAESHNLDLQHAISSLQSQWHQVDSLSGVVESRGIKGFSRDADATPAKLTVSVKTSGGKVVEATGQRSKKNLAPIIRTEWHENSAGLFEVKLSRTYVMPTPDLPSPIEFTDESWDGHSFSLLRKDVASSFATQKNIPIHVNGIDLKRFLSTPFLFLSPSVANSELAQVPNDQRFPSLKMLHNPETFANLLQTAKSLQTRTLGQKSCLTFQITGGVDPFLGIPMTYQVYLDPEEGYYPIGWDRLDATTGNLVEEYRISELGKINTPLGTLFRYPKIASCTYYKFMETKTGSPSVVNVAYEEKIDSISVNSTPDFDYSIDLSSAEYIIDNDKGTLIHVPK